MTSFYETYAAQHLTIDETEDNQLFCTIPSEKDVNIRYRLECKESTTGVEVLSCSCPSRKHDCKHVAILTSFWARIYKSNVLKAEQKATEVVEVAPIVEERAKVWDKDLCTMVYADNGEIVDPQAHAAKMKLQREAYEAEMAFREGKVFDSVLQEWVELPSEEPVDHFESLKGTRVGQRQETERLMAQTRAENTRIKARRILESNLNGAQQNAEFWNSLPSRATA